MTEFVETAMRNMCRNPGAVPNYRRRFLIQKTPSAPVAAIPASTAHAVAYASAP
jgi:hypothetical protein